jgi:hypothetical protein
MDWKRKKTVIPKCDCSVHDVISGIAEYLIITPIFAIGYLTVTIPWMLFVIGLDSEQFINFVWQSVMVDLVVAYPLAKLVMRLKPRIERLAKLGH